MTNLPKSRFAIVIALAQSNLMHYLLRTGVGVFTSFFRILVLKSLELGLSKRHFEISLTTSSNHFQKRFKNRMEILGILAGLQNTIYSKFIGKFCKWHFSQLFTLK
jgi:hypothetical protein